MSPVENKYAVGDLVRLCARFQNPATGAYLRPGTVECEVKDPDGVISTPASTYDAALETPDSLVAAGFYAEVDVEKPGTWYYRFAATGTGQGAQEGSFYVERSAFS